MSSQEGQNYTFGEKLGSGSYSTVYKAYPKGTDRKIVAVKVIKKSLSVVDNLISEIRLLKSLKHKHIVEMIDFFWDDTNIMIVMEYCNGGDLSSFIKRRSRLPEIVCKRFLQQLADALKYLRSRNISHMDLKPSNLLLSSGHVLKLADFGFAQYLSSEEKKNSLRGSPLYMAPEMLLEHKYDAKVDLWSVGVIMYECLFGRAPYSSRTFEELAEKIRHKAPIEIPSGSIISAGCADLLKKLLVHDPQQRIDFESFFKSEYLDLEHMPCEASMEKAINLVHRAIQHDVENKHREAFTFYCDALQYFVPLINAETDENKKVILRNKVDQYVKRAEELKVQLHGGSNDAQQPSGSREDGYQRLTNLCASTPKLVEALRIGHVAEQYLAEGKHVTALSDFQLSIGTLLGYLGNEPAGVRKDLLRRQTERWLQLAEDAKRASTLQTYPTTKIEASTVGKEMCLLQ